MEWLTKTVGRVKNVAELIGWVAPQGMSVLLGKMTIKQFMMNLAWLQAQFIRAGYEQLIEKIKANEIDKATAQRLHDGLSKFHQNNLLFVERLKLMESSETHRPDLSKHAEPPRVATKFLCLVLPHYRQQEILGCLEEEFRTFICPKYSTRYAWFWYWRQAIGSAVSHLLSQIPKLLGVLLFSAVVVAAWSSLV